MLKTKPELEILNRPELLHFPTSGQGEIGSVNETGVSRETIDPGKFENSVIQLPEVLLKAYSKSLFHLLGDM